MNADPLNVFDEPLLPCSEDPVTGFFRDGCCNTNDQDTGSHTICIQVTDEFLQYSRFAGNDRSTPRWLSENSCVTAGILLFQFFKKASFICSG